MAAANEVLVNELSKINKKDIINILVYRKIPTGIVLNSVVNEFFNNLGVRSENSKTKTNCSSDIEGEVATECENIQCIKQCLQSKSYHNERNLLRNMTQHLEHRIRDQEVIIQLLQKNVNENNNNKIDIPHDITVPSSGQRLKHSHITNDKQHTVSAENRNLTLSNVKGHINSEKRNNNGEQCSIATASQPANDKNHPRQNTSHSNITLSQVNKAVDGAVANTLSAYTRTRPIRKQHNNNRKTVIGTNNNSSIKAVPKLGYLHVYRLSPQTTTDHLKQHLARSAPNIDFNCEVLNTNDKSTSFMVSFPIEFVGEVYDSDIWPSGACVRRYIFKRNVPNQPNFQNISSANQRT